MESPRAPSGACDDLQRAVDQAFDIAAAAEDHEIDERLALGQISEVLAPHVTDVRDQA